VIVQHRGANEETCCVGVVFPHLKQVQVERVEDDGGGVWIAVRTYLAEAACHRCGVASTRIHSRYRRRLQDVAAGGRPVVIKLEVRRFFCGNDACRLRTFAEQVPGLTVRHGRRSVVLTRLLQAVALALGGRPGARLVQRLACAVSRMTLLRLIRSLPLPGAGSVQVLGVDDFALQRGHRYATVLIDAATHRRVDVLPDRRASTLAGWLREHPGVRMVCRDGSAAYAEAVRQGAPDAVQISDRWHLWHNLAAAVQKTVVAHSGCWHAGPPRTTSAREERTRQRHAAVHELLSQDVGLLECSRRLGWALNTVKRYARAESAEALRRPPQYRRTLVDPYRDHLRRRLAEQPGVPVTRLLAEIRDQGYPGSANLLVRYLNQGRTDPERVPPSPRRLAAWLMTRPGNLPEHRRRHLEELVSACPHLTVLATRVRQFAELLTQRRGADLDAWITTVRDDDLPALHAFADGLDNDHDAVVAGLTLPYSNGPTEGVNTKIKMIKRQMYGRASFDLLRRRILLAD
jgi:transposase